MIIAFLLLKRLHGIELLLILHMLGRMFIVSEFAVMLSLRIQMVSRNFCPWRHFFFIYFYHVK